METSTSGTPRRSTGWISVRDVGGWAARLAAGPGRTDPPTVNREEPLVRRYHERLASFSRLILMDERGTGMSDPLPLSQIPTPEEQMDDISAVLDELDVAHAVPLGDEDGGPLAMLFAATHRKRVDRLVLYGTYPALMADVDYPIGFAPDLVELVIAGAADSWGTLTELPEDFAPSDPSFRRRVVETVSSVASPGQAQALIRRSYLWKVRPFLGAVRVSTFLAPGRRPRHPGRHGTLHRRSHRGRPLHRTGR